MFCAFVITLEESTKLRWGCKFVHEEVDYTRIATVFVVFLFLFLFLFFLFFLLVKITLS